jgi:hypothetical protein
LVDILHRMKRHHYKKRSIFRRLRVSTLAETSASDSIRRPGPQARGQASSSPRRARGAGGNVRRWTF